MIRLLLAVVLALTLAACAPATRVILLPQAGSIGAVDVNTQASTVELTVEYAQAEVGAGGEVQAGQADAGQVQSRYRQLLAVAPPQQHSFTLYFETGGTALTPESQALLDSVLDMATRQPGADIVVTGHTDSVGSLHDNDRLSLERARVIHSQLVSRGYDPRRVEAVGRGERELLVPTADEVPEPRNRRTVIIVR